MNNEQYQQLLLHYEALERENERLKVLLRKHGITYVPDRIKIPDTSPYSPISFPPVRLSLDGKVRLFRSLFRGREDVYARRWQSRTTGKGGYQPVCTNEWRTGVCDKRQYKCAECPNRNFETLNDRAVYRHLEGRNEDCLDVIGLYTIMPDNSCAFLCTDFDDKNCEHGYKGDVKAFIDVCKEWSIPYAIERSRSGNGAHVWIFFEDVLPAYKARQVGSAILTEAMNRNGRMSFKSYDRFFPNQDYLSEGGLGNLVALPLQGRARRKLNTVFVDDDFLAYQDQWAFLSQIKKMTAGTVEKVLAEHRQAELGPLSVSDEQKPWTPPIVQPIGNSDIYENVEIVKADKLYIPIKAVSAKVLNHLKCIAAFKNPEYYRRQAMRLSTYSVPRVISCCEFTEDFSKPKVVYMEIQTDNPEEGYPFPCYSYDDKSCVVLNTAYIMSSETIDLRYVLGILNSRLGKFLVKLYVTQLQERQFRMLSQYVTKFPIARPSKEQETEMIYYVRDVIAYHSKVSEKLIDELAFKIYKLSDIEINSFFRR